MKRLVCVVEGHGEVEAVPVLCHRVLRSILGVEDWFVDASPIRSSRGRLVDESRPSPDRPCLLAEVDRSVAIAAARGARGVLVLCDADNDCPAAWGRSIPAGHSVRGLAVRGVMASREFESWLLWSRSDADRLSVKAPNPEVGPRDAKAALSRLIPGYAPSTHQRDAVRVTDVRAVWRRSRSFQRLVKALAELVGAEVPPLPVGQP